MKKILIILGLALLSLTSSKENIQITYVANCGFLYESSSQKVLIDPFGTRFGNLFNLPSSETMTKIENGTTPFDQINLVLITHIHGDHFDPFPAEKFLLQNTHTQLVCPPQVRQQMKDSCQNFVQIEAQILSPQLSMSEIKTIPVNGIQLTIVRMQHGTNRSLQEVDYKDYTDYEKTEDYGYLFELGNKVIFHQGDGCLKINQEALDKLNQKVDVAFLSYFDWDTSSFNLLKDKLQAQNIIFMHGTKPAKEREKEEFKVMEPKLILFNQELENKTF
ncbi:MAG TPA: MBL fold metallo-hydrolase [Draconibacterium sp.]|nr:MBL fold metallo-hydrolase [Draconibacterium sp.]